MNFDPRGIGLKLRYPRSTVVGKTLSPKDTQRPKSFLEAFLKVAILIAPVILKDDSKADLVTADAIGG